MFDLADLQCNEDAAYDFLCKTARLFRDFVKTTGPQEYYKFSDVKSGYSGITKVVADDDLNPQRLAALRAIRHVAVDIARLTTTLPSGLGSYWQANATPPMVGRTASTSYGST